MHESDPSRPARPGATRDRVLDAAERLFAERGVDAVSIRDITGAAGANLGAINYHFGTKDNLITAVFDRRIGQVSQDRLRALDAVEKAAAGRPPTLEALLEAMVRPEVERTMDAQRGGVAFGKLMARCLVEPNPAVETVMRRRGEPVVRRFDGALMRVMPQLTAEDVFWRMHLLMGALHQSLLMLGRRLPGGRTLRMDPETYVRRFVAFAAAGFRAELPPASTRRHP
ncbi:MAG: CerR family C-terminal domain-containing protein [Verrucomicrobia bacterium]|nr:CerR family C-terminal domain-containing protein [Verrucomicrobiota bacterium]